MTGKRLAMLGGGGFAREVAEIAEMNGYSIEACYALDPGSFQPVHRGYLPELAAEIGSYDGLALGIGATDRRSLRRRQELIDWIRSHRISCPPIVSPHAIVAHSATVGDGGFVAHGVILGLDAVVEPFGLLNSGVIVGHDVHIATNAIVAPGAFLGGSSRVNEGSLVGPLAKVLQGVTVGKDVIVGIGCTALRSIADGSTVWPRPDRAT